MRVPYGEGLATQAGPESCVGPREGVGEALTGEHVGRPLSRESTLASGADVVDRAEGTTDRCRPSAWAEAREYERERLAGGHVPGRGRRPRHAWTLFVREPGDLPLGRRAWVAAVRIGKAGGRSR